MERLEDGPGRARASCTAELAELDATVAALGAAPRRQARELDEQLATVGRRARDRRAGVPADLLALYERLRAQKGGVGAAALRAARVQRLPADARTPADLGDHRDGAAPTR